MKKKGIVFFVVAGMLTSNAFGMKKVIKQSRNLNLNTLKKFKYAKELNGNKSIKGKILAALLVGAGGNYLYSKQQEQEINEQKFKSELLQLNLKCKVLSYLVFFSNNKASKNLWSFTQPQEGSDDDELDHNPYLMMRDFCDAFLKLSAYDQKSALRTLRGHEINFCPGFVRIVALMIKPEMFLLHIEDPHLFVRIVDDLERRLIEKDTTLLVLAYDEGIFDENYWIIRDKVSMHEISEKDLCKIRRQYKAYKAL